MSGGYVFMKKAIRKIWGMCSSMWVGFYTRNKFFIKVKEKREYKKFEQSFEKIYISGYNITNASECIFRQTYYNDRNRLLVLLCREGNMGEIKKWYEEMDGDKIYSDEYFDNRMSMRIIAKHICRNMPRDSFILDVACGHGEIDKVLSRNGYRVTGVDLNFNRIKELKKSIYKAECVALEDMDVNLKYDVIISLEMLEHVQNIYITLKKIYELLKCGGVFYLSVPNERMIDDEQHVRFFDSDSITALMQYTGFQVISVTTLPYLNKEKDNDLVCVAKK